MTFDEYCQLISSAYVSIAVSLGKIGRALYRTRYFLLALNMNPHIWWGYLLVLVRVVCSLFIDVRDTYQRMMIMDGPMNEEERALEKSYNEARLLKLTGNDIYHWILFRMSERDQAFSPKDNHPLLPQGKLDQLRIRFILEHCPKLNVGVSKIRERLNYAKRSCATSGMTTSSVDDLDQLLSSVFELEGSLIKDYRVIADPVCLYHMALCVQVYREQTQPDTNAILNRFFALYPNRLLLDVLKEQLELATEKENVTGALERLRKVVQIALFVNRYLKQESLESRMKAGDPIVAAYLAKYCHENDDDSQLRRILLAFDDAKQRHQWTFADQVSMKFGKKVSEKGLRACWQYHHQQERKARQALTSSRERVFYYLGEGFAYVNNAVYTIFAWKSTYVSFCVVFGFGALSAGVCASLICLGVTCVAHYFYRPRIVSAIEALGHLLEEGGLHYYHCVHASRKWMDFFLFLLVTSLIVASFFLYFDTWIKFFMGLGVSAAISFWSGIVCVGLMSLASWVFQFRFISNQFDNAAPWSSFNWREALESGRVIRFVIAILLGVVFASVASAIQAMGDYFGMVEIFHYHLPTFWLYFLSVASFIGNQAYNLLPCCDGMVETVDTFLKNIWDSEPFLAYHHQVAPCHEFSRPDEVPLLPYSRHIEEETEQENNWRLPLPNDR